MHYEAAPLISVIVPVYKVEKYLDRCIGSIVGQTYHNLEIILVDDGSPDKCPAKCDNWAKRDARIKTIHKENGGLSDARNVGMAVAAGEFTAFVDSDDWMAPNMISILYESIVSTKSDIASCGALRVWASDGKTLPLHVYDEDIVLEGHDALKALIESSYLVATVWNKLYKTAVIRDIPFEVGKIHEDEYWSWQAIAEAKRVSVVKEALYYYYQREDSIMGSGYTGDPFLVINAKLLRQKYIDENAPELSDIGNCDLLYTCYYNGCEIVKCECREKKKLLKRLHEVARKCMITKTYLRKLTLKKRFRIWSIRSFLPFVCSVDVSMKIA